MHQFELTDPVHTKGQLISKEFFFSSHTPKNQRILLQISALASKKP